MQDRQTVFSLEFNEQGQISRLQCPTTSVVADDRKPCGFEGRVDTALYSAAGEKTGQRLYDNGRLLEATSLQADGKLASQHLFEGGQRVHRSFSSQGSAQGKSVLREERVFEADTNLLSATRGKLLYTKLWGANEQITEHRRFADGIETMLERWYLNGAMKERTSTSASTTGNTADARLQRESFNDAGVLVRREQLVKAAREYDRHYTGVQQAFHDNGKLAAQETWSEPDDRGRTRLVARKQWDETGRLLADDDILEDGSRKRKAG